MTAQEARERVQQKRGYEGTEQAYNYFQTKIEEAVLEGNLNCEVRVPISSFYIDHEGRIHQMANYPKIEKVMSLLRNDGFYCRVSQSGENWKVEVEW